MPYLLFRLIILGCIIFMFQFLYVLSPLVNKRKDKKANSFKRERRRKENKCYSDNAAVFCAEFKRVAPRSNPLSIRLFIFPAQQRENRVHRQTIIHVVEKSCKIICGRWKHLSRDVNTFGLLGSNYFTNNALWERVAWLQPHLETPSRQEHSQNSCALFKSTRNTPQRARERVLNIPLFFSYIYFNLLLMRSVVLLSSGAQLNTRRTRGCKS